MFARCMLVTFLIVLLGQPATSSDQPHGRHFELKATIPAPPADVYAMWTTEAGIRRFLAPKAKVRPEPGGEYTIMFWPEGDPEGESFGTKGARVLRAEPGKALAFEWISFSGIAGRSGPPYAPPEVRNQRPIPTWVALTFEPGDEKAETTILTLRHAGFGEGELWDRALSYFRDRAWPHVLRRLQEACAVAQEVEPK